VLRAERPGGAFSWPSLGVDVILQSYSTYCCRTEETLSGSRVSFGTGKPSEPDLMFGSFKEDSSPNFYSFCVLALLAAGELR
jgi:hypothetical protein